VTTARLYLNLPPQTPKNWGQISSNINDYYSDPREISSTLWLPEITDWWGQQEEMLLKYADLSNVAHDIVSILPHGVGVKASFSLGRDVIDWRHSETTGETLWDQAVVGQFAWANTRIWVGQCAALDDTDTENDLELKKQAEEWKLHRMAKVHDFLEMWQGSQNLYATQKESHAQKKHMTAVGYISDTEEIIKASWSIIQHDGPAAFKSSERSPLPPALSAIDLPGGRTQVLIVHRLKRINDHPAESYDDSAPESISDTGHWLDWNGGFDNPNNSEGDCKADDESDIEPHNGIKDSESPEHWVVSATPNVPGLIRPTWRSKTLAEMGLMTVSAMETRKNKGNKKK